MAARREVTPMKETTLRIDNWKSVLDAQCIEHCLMRVPGVLHAEANFMSGTATVHYDEAKTSVPALKRWLDEGGFECRRASLPEQLVPSTRSPSDPMAMEHSG